MLDDIPSSQITRDGFEWNLITLWELININLSSKHCYNPVCGQSMPLVSTDRGC